MNDTKFKRPEGQNCKMPEMPKGSVPALSAGTAAYMYAHGMTEEVDLQFTEDSKEKREAVGKMDNPVYSGSEMAGSPTANTLAGAATVPVGDLSGNVTHNGLNLA